jgi:hydrogenase maturation protease
VNNERKPAVLLIGVGNPLRGDDGAGPMLVRQLQDRLPASVEVLELDGEGTRLMAAWEGADTVILVDATRSGAEPGTVYRFDAAETAVPADLFHYSSHLIGVAEAVELARSLGRLPQRVLIYGIEGAHFGFGTALSPAVAAAVADVAEEVRAWLWQGNESALPPAFSAR